MSGVPVTAAEDGLGEARSGEIRALVAHLLSDTQGCDDKAFLGARFDAGLAWVHFPLGRGGLGVDPSYQGIVDAELAAAGRAANWMRNPMGIGMVAPALVAWGTEEQQRFLRPIFTAEQIWCQLFSEPGAGSDLATLACRAVRSGDGWVVNGQKVWTTRAHLARYGFLLARTDPEMPKHQGLTAFVVDMRANGVETRPLRQMTGHADFNEVFLSDVWLPDISRVGPVGNGWRVALTTLANERNAIAADPVSIIDGPLGHLIAAWHASARRNPVHRDAVVRLRSEMTILTWMSQRQRDSVDGSGAPDPALLKVMRALLNKRIANLALDLTGPAGMLVPGYDGAISRDDDIALTFLFGPAFTIAGGTTEILKTLIAERILGLPPEPRADKDMPWTSIPRSSA
jgi:alkylation response protein AidB-like acyl-CoA dehydrogenase